MPSPEFVRPAAALLALRPVIALEATDAAGTVAAFLHATLRPALKLQNDLLLAVAADFVRDHHIALRPTEPQPLAELLARNTKLRYTVVGLITGVFTTDEYAFYRQHRAELNRRLLEMAQRRVLGQAAAIGELAASQA